MGFLGVSSEHQSEGREGPRRRSPGQPGPHVLSEGLAAFPEAAGGGVLDEDPAQAQPHRRQPLQGEFLKLCPRVDRSRFFSTPVYIVTAASPSRTSA